MSQDTPTSRSADETIEEVFLTPRVIDKKALEDYSATLQGLIREAAGRGQSLVTAANDVKALGDNLREATKEIKARLETAVKIMPTLEQKLGKAEQVLQFATDKVKLAEHLDRTLDELLRERIDRLQAQMSGAIDRTASDLAQRCEAVVADAQFRLAAAGAATLAPAESTLAEVHTKLQSARTALAEIESRLAGASIATDAQIDERLGAISAKLADAESRWTATIDAAEARLSEAADVARARVDPALTAVNALLDRAEAMASPSEVGSLTAMISRAESLRAAAADASSRFDEIRKQADLARVMLGDWISTAASRIDQENSRQAALDAAIDAAARRIDEARAAHDELAHGISRAAQLADQAATMLTATATKLAASAAPPHAITEPKDPLPQAVQDSIRRARSEIER